MDSILSEAEGMLVEWIVRHLDRSEQKDIHCGADILRSLSMDAEDEVKNQVWELVKRELNYGWVVNKVQDHIKNEPQTESENEDEYEEVEEEEGNESDN
jgi:hypothetical protein